MLNQCKCNETGGEIIIPSIKFPAIQSNTLVLKCETCHQQNTVSLKNIHLNQILLLEVDENNQSMSFDELKKVIIVNETAYLLCGIVESIPSTDLNSPNHFRGYMLRANRWFVYDYSFEKKKLYPSKTKFKLIPKLYVYAIHKLVFDDIQYLSLTNSNVVHFKNFSINKCRGKPTFIKNSCGPDSVLQALCCMYSECSIFRDVCILRKMESKSSLFDLFEFSNNNNSVKAHDIRNKLLSDVFECDESEDGLITIDCESNIYNMIESLITPIFPSVRTLKTCSGCNKGGFTRVHTVLEIDSKTLSANGISDLQSCILDRFISENKTICKNCNGNKVITNELGIVIFIDVQTVEFGKEKYGISSPVSIDEIPKMIELKTNTYELQSVICYQPSYDSKFLGHYTAVCKVDGKWQEFDDTKTETSAYTSYEVRPQTLIYILKTK